MSMQLLIALVMQVCSLSTITREYVALHSVGSLPFKDLIIKATEKTSELEDQEWKISRPLEEYIKDNLNKSQWDAIQVICSLYDLYT